MRAWLNHLPVNPRQEPSQIVLREHPHPQDELRLVWLIATPVARALYVPVAEVVAS
jgi:hypothetical protein